ncbi:anti-sigma factor [Kribbella sp. NPDC051770]|uniref:anti-sigma factor n=1 Tax=Kribbella sp. NPDC051770 TaxID=3155413 RepID=UPI00342A7406
MRDEQSQDSVAGQRWPDASSLGGDARELESLLLLPQMWAEVPAELKDRCLAVSRVAESEPASVVPFRVSRSLRQRATRPRRRLAVLAAAAAAVIAAATGLVITAGQPETQTFALSGTALATGAKGTAELRETPSGFEITLRTSGLEGAAPGTYYEAWVKGEKGLVPIGTFHLRGGPDRVVLWSGVDMVAYPTMTVTVQPEGGGAASSGRVVLSGAVPRGPR